MPKLDGRMHYFAAIYAALGAPQTQQSVIHTFVRLLKGPNKFGVLGRLSIVQRHLNNRLIAQARGCCEFWRIAGVSSRSIYCSFDFFTTERSS